MFALPHEPQKSAEWQAFREFITKIELAVFFGAGITEVRIHKVIGNQC